MIVLYFSLSEVLWAQVIPNEIENIDYLVTFGKDGDTSWGDDDFIQIYFFSIPASHEAPFYIRIFDPDTGDHLDEIKGIPDSSTKFSLFGGKGAYSQNEARLFKPEKNYDSGTLLDTRQFSQSKEYDRQWFTMGPFFPVQGELMELEQKYYFKLIAEGVSGNDGNLYKYALSDNPTKNVEVLGSNAFTYAYTFRLPDDPNRITHIYPFITDDVVSIDVHNFDFDRGGNAYIYSVTKNRHLVKTGGEDEWASSNHIIDQEEKNSSIDIQVINNGIKNNNVVIYITNQYKKPIPFFTIPIGGPPKYKYKVNFEYTAQPTHQE